MKKIMKVVFSGLMIMSLVACSTNKKSIDIQELQTKMLEQSETLMIPKAVILTEEEFSGIYGVDMSLVEEIAASRAMMSAQLCDILMIKPTDGNSDEVINAIKSSYEAMNLYPFMLEFVENMQVIEEGDTIIIVVAENADEIAQWLETEIK